MILFNIGRNTTFTIEFPLYNLITWMRFIS